VECAACHTPIADGAAACDRCGQPATPAVSDPLIGSLLGGRYRLIAQLGRGGMGVVYRAEHVLMKKELAVKLLHPELGALEELARRFEREAQSASRLNHPNIVSVTDFGHTEDGTLFLAMELIEGEPLAAIIERGRLAPTRAARLMAQVLRALEHAHAQGVIHRDLKPDNVFVNQREGEEVVKLLDFGIALMVGGGGSEAITRAGVVFGTPEYLSPEQALGEVADARADIYAAGVMLYEMLAGERPFQSNSSVTLVSMHLTRPVPSLRQQFPEAGIWPELEQSVLRAMAKERSERYGSATEFREALERQANRSLTVNIPIPVRGWWGERFRQVARWVRETTSAVLDRMERGRLGPLLARSAAGLGLGSARPVAAGVLGFGALVLMILLAGLVRRGHAPRAERITPEVVSALDRAAHLLATADLGGARAVLQQQLSAHPKAARVHYLLGNLHYAEGNRTQTLGDYRTAIELDGNYRGDATLLANLRTLVETRSLTDPTLELLVDGIGKAALPQLVDCARTCRDSSVRHDAVDAVLKLAGPDGLPESVRGDEIDRQVALLESNKSCRERKRAVAALVALGDRRALEPLRRAQDRRLLLVKRVNSCMDRELNDAIHELEKK
jgi:tRNA A-37 threonylcarbamoyl transferase component Bud32